MMNIEMNTDPNGDSVVGVGRTVDIDGKIEKQDLQIGLKKSNKQGQSKVIIPNLQRIPKNHNLHQHSNDPSVNTSPPLAKTEISMTIEDSNSPTSSANKS